MKLICLLLMLGGGAFAQDAPEILIRRLTDQDLSFEDYTAKYGVFTCGKDLRITEEKRTATEALVDLGAAAVPELERAINSFTTGNAPGDVWILQAYASLKGPASVARLEELRRILPDGNYAINNAIARARGLTSYVRGSGSGGKKVFVCSSDRRIALDQVILNHPHLPASAIGYYFDHPGPAAARASVQVAFFTSDGKDCGTYPVRFVARTDPWLGLKVADASKLWPVLKRCGYK